VTFLTLLIKFNYNFNVFTAVTCTK